MSKILIPHKFSPRTYQLPLLKALDRGIKRAVIVWHRRSGKDKVCFNFMVKKACERVGTYFYFLPEFAQAKKVVWDNIDNDGFKMLHHIPAELIKATNATELKIELINGSIIQLIGADTFDKSGVGTNPIGVVMSEYSVNKPEIWDFIRPILRVNGGWAIFNFTPRGQNHAFKMLEMAKDNPEWFTQVLTVDDTGVLSHADIEAERREGMTQAMIDQEFYCKFIESATSFFKRIDEACILFEKEYDTRHFYKMGVDLGKYQDFTTISVIDLNTFEEVYKERFNQMEWSYQKARIESVYRKFGNPIGHIDATGVGDPVVEDLIAQGVALEPIKFTEMNRKDILTNLAMVLEGLKVKFLNDPVFKAELSYFQFMLSENGKLKIGVPDGLHDDTVFAAALAVWEMPNKPMRINRETADYQTGGVEPLYEELGVF